MLKDRATSDATRYPAIARRRPSIRAHTFPLFVLSSEIIIAFSPFEPLSNRRTVIPAGISVRSTIERAVIEVSFSNREIDFTLNDEALFTTGTAISLAPSIRFVNPQPDTPLIIIVRGTLGKRIESSHRRSAGIFHCSGTLRSFTNNPLAFRKLCQKFGCWGRPCR